MPNVSFDILGRDKASKSFDKVGQASDRVERKFGILSARSHGLTAGIATGFGKILPILGAVASIEVFKGFIQDAAESAKVGRLTAAAIKSTGGAAKVTAQQVGDLATAISNKTGADDETIQSGANLLLTFTNIRNELGKGNDIFNQATQTVTDMAAALNGGEVSTSGVKSASIQLGKALNDPIKGVASLTKVGVTFSQKQKDQIKTLVESGRTMDAQKVILKELSKEFGGAAAAAGDPFTRLKTILGNVSETIGGYLLPYAEKAATWIGDNLPAAVEKGGKFFNEKLLPPLRTVADFVRDRVIPVAENIVDTFAGLGGRIVSAIGKIDLGGIAEDIFTGASKWAGRLIDGVKTGVQTGNWKPLGTAIGDAVSKAVSGAGDAAGKLLDAVGALLDKVDWGKLGSKVSGAFLGLIHSIDWDRIGGAVGDALITALQKVKDVSTRLGNAIQAFINAVDWERVGHDSTTAIGRFIAGVDWASLAKSLGIAVVNGLKIDYKVGRTVINAVVDILDGAYHALGEWGKQKAMEWGPKLWEGLKSGIVAGAKGVGGWVQSTFIDPFVRWVKQALGIKSPSTVFAAIGVQVVAGFKAGISSAARGIGSWVGRAVANPAVAIFAPAGSWLVKHGRNLVAGFKNGVAEIAAGVGRFVYDRVAVPAARVFGGAGSWLSRAGRDLIGGLMGGIAVRMKGVAGWIKTNVVDKIVGAVKSFFGIHSPSTVFAGIGSNLVAGLFQGMGSNVGTAIAKKVFGDMPSALRAIVGKGLISVQNLPRKALDALGSAVGIGSPIGGPAGNTNNEGIVRTLASQYGWGSGAQWSALRSLIMGESGFRNTAQNPTSSAYGIFQFLDSTWGTVGASKTSDPWAQTIAGLKYIARSYGDPINAFAKWSSRSPHWYANGGVIAEKVLGVGLSSGRKYGFGEHGAEQLTPVGRMPKAGGSAARVVLEFRSDGSAQMNYLISEVRKYVRVAGGGNVQVALGASR